MFMKNTIGYAYERQTTDTQQYQLCIYEVQDKSGILKFKEIKKMAFFDEGSRDFQIEKLEKEGIVDKQYYLNRKETDSKKVTF